MHIDIPISITHQALYAINVTRFHMSDMYNDHQTQHLNTRYQAYALQTCSQRAVVGRCIGYNDAVYGIGNLFQYNTALIGHVE